jgi:hypothetical protein
MRNSVGILILMLVGGIAGSMAPSVGIALTHGALMSLAYTIGCLVGNNENND